MFSSISKKTSSVLVALFTAFSVMTGSTPAHASPIATGVINGIQFQAQNNQMLVNLSNGSQYRISTAPPSGCSSFTVTADQFKIAVSIVQSGLLSGKKVNVIYDVCNGANYFFTIDLYN